MSEPRGPLDRISSVKLKLGVLVAVSVAVAAILATVSSGVAPWLSIPVTILMALGVTQLLATGMTSPLRQMTQVARQMARGDYSGRVHTTASDEVGQLAEAFS
jgi:two-component system sensor histidine kinase BaeS